MFTGLIKDVGHVTRIEKNAGEAVLTIRSTNLNLNDEKIGASIACNGVCLTLTEKNGKDFKVMASAETLAKTTIGSWQINTLVNLEASLRLGDELGGHLVYGHVDAVATCVSVKPENNSWRMIFEIPANLKAFVATKGSVTLDGVSLTVNEVDGARFGVNIIPHTFDHTNFGSMEAGDQVNFEIDMLARYMARMLEARAA